MNMTKPSGSKDCEKKNLEVVKVYIVMKGVCLGFVPGVTEFGFARVLGIFQPGSTDRGRCCRLTPHSGVPGN